MANKLDVIIISLDKQKNVLLRFLIFETLSQRFLLNIFRDLNNIKIEINEDMAKQSYAGTTDTNKQCTSLKLCHTDFCQTY